MVKDRNVRYYMRLTHWISPCNHFGTCYYFNSYLDSHQIGKLIEGPHIHERKVVRLSYVYRSLPALTDDVGVKDQVR